MKTMAIGQFKDRCLKTIDDIARTRTPVIITKRGRPVAKLVPYVEAAPTNSLVGSVIKESGDPFSTNESWDAGTP